MEVAIITPDELKSFLKELEEVKSRVSFSSQINSEVPEWASLKQLQKITSISYKQIQTLVSAKAVRKTQILGSVKYSKNDLVEYIYNNQDVYHLKSA